MTSILDAFYPGDDGTLLVANVLIQITAVILLTMVATRSLLRRSPAAAHAAWLACLAFVTACPLIVFVASHAGMSMVALPAACEVASAAPEAAPTALGPGSGREIPAAGEGGFSVVEPGTEGLERVADSQWVNRQAMETEQGNRVPTAVVVAASSAPEGRSVTWRTAISVAVVLWATGSLLLALRLLHGACCAIRLRRATTPLDGSAFADVLDRVRQSTGMADLPSILLSEQVDTPLVIAGIRPLILLPASLPGTIDRKHMHDVLVHECAHVIRRDHLIGLLQRLLEIVYWPHPLVHSMNRQLAACREEVCDNHVLAAVGSADYADTLLELAVRTQDRIGMLHSIGMFGLRWKLEDRVQGLLDRGRDQSVRLGSLARLALFSTGVVAIVAAMTLQLSLAAGDRETEPLSNLAVAPDEDTPSDTAASPIGEVGEFLDVDGDAWKPGHDIDGELLPAGTKARLGSRRLRHEGWHKRIWISSDNKTLISTCPNNSVRFWDVGTGKLQRELDLDSKQFVAMDVSHSADSLVILARQSDGESHETALTLWDTNTWLERPIATWNVEESVADCVAISPSGSTLATGSRRGTVRIWDSNSGKELLSQSMGKRDVESLAFSPDDTLVAIATRDNVLLWEWQTGEKAEPLSGRLDRAQAVAFSPDGRLLATGNRDNLAARLWDVTSRRLVAPLKGKASSYYREGLTFSSDGRSLIVPAARAKTVEVFDVETGQLTQSLNARSVKPRDVAVSTDGQILAAIGTEAAIKLWSLPEGQCLSDRFVGHEETACELVYTPTGQHIVTGSLDGTIRIWQADTGQQVQVLTCQHWVTGVALSPDEKRVVSCGLDDTVRLWDARSGRQIFRLPGHGRLGGEGHYVVGFNRTGDRFLSFGPDLNLRVWSTKTGKVVAEHAIRPSGMELVEAEDGTVRTTAPNQGDPFGGDGSLFGILEQARFTADGDRLFLSAGQFIYVFGTDSGEEIDQWTPKNPLNKFNISPDGKMLIVLESRRPTPGGQPQHVLAPQRQQLLAIHRYPFEDEGREIELGKTSTQALAVSRDGRFIAASRRESARPRQHWVSVWNVETGQEVARIDQVERQMIRSIAFSPEGTSLAATYWDTTTLVWDWEQFRVEVSKAE